MHSDAHVNPRHLCMDNSTAFALSAVLRCHVVTAMVTLMFVASALGLMSSWKWENAFEIGEDCWQFF